MEQGDISQLRTSYKAHLDSELAKADTFNPQLTVLQNKWKELVVPMSNDAVHNPETGVSAAVLKDVGKASVAVPESFVSNNYPLAQKFCELKFILHEGNPSSP